ncbi:DUF3820 family protein [Ferruginibacter profundus]
MNNNWYKVYALDLIMDNNENVPNGELLLQLVSMKMPFGKYKGTVLCNLPVSYLEWFQRKGFPEGKLGVLLATIYEIKINGLEELLGPLKK